MTAEILLASLQISTPELILAVGALALLMFGVFSGDRSAPTVTGLAVAILIAAGLWLVLVPAEGEAWGGAFILDSFSRYMKVIALVGSITAMVMTVGNARSEQLDRFEFPVLLVLATLGMMLLISANDLLALYLGLELMSLALYVVAAINRDSLRSTEAGLKYFVLGALSSGMLLYGMSLIYGFTGNTGFDEIAAVLTSETRSLGVVFGLVFILAGLAFKISAVPFHMWTPDVYEGAPTPVTAFAPQKPA
jgi:NADH-quinone oxidoreductase subunit N